MTSGNDTPSSLFLPLIVPPSLALLYAASVQAFQAAWRDTQTFPARSIVGRAALVGAAATLAATAASDRYTVQEKATNRNQQQLTIAVAGVGGTLLSTWLIRRTRQKYVQGPPPNIRENSIAGRVYLVTGANTGIGYETAKQLYEAGATVVLACRNETKAKEATDSILCSGKGSDADMIAKKKRLILLKIDVSDLSSVRLAAQNFKDMGIPLHCLILNAGIMMPERRESVDGLELMMVANHFGHFLLTQLLLPILREAEDARVVVLTSSTYTLAKPDGIDIKDLQCQHRKYTMFSQYAQTKLANILFVRELARREQEITRKPVKKKVLVHPVKAYAVHPGLVRTDVVRNMPWYLYYPNVVFGFAVAALQKTPAAGAWTSCYCAASKHVKRESGKYYANCRRQPLDAVARDDEAAKELWTLSEKIVGLN